MNPRAGPGPSLAPPCSSRSRACCAQEPEFITGIVHQTPERPNEFVFYELWGGTRADFDAIQGPKPYRKAYMENVKPFLEKADVEWNSPILEWGTNLTGL